MGGKPLKPKIQAYVEQRWFDEFEIYRSSHNLNQSKALEQILAEFFAGTSKPAAELETAIAPTLVDSLRAELAELRQTVEQRLQIVESRLAVESAVPLSRLATESVDELAITQAESVEYLVELNAELAANSALRMEKLEDESRDKLAIVSAFVEATTALNEAKSATSSATNSAIVEDAIALNPIEEVAPVEVEENAIASDSEGILELTEKCATVVALSEEAIASNSKDIVGPATTGNELVEEEVSVSVIMTDTKLETPNTPAKKRGKQPPREIKKLIEAKLAFGQQVTADELAGIVDGTASGIRARRKEGKLHEWGVQSVPGSRPEMFERI